MTYSMKLNLIAVIGTSIFLFLTIYYTLSILEFYLSKGENND